MCCVCQDKARQEKVLIEKAREILSNRLEVGREYNPCFIYKIISWHIDMLGWARGD